MDLSSLIASNPELNVKHKNTDRLFYDQYSYSLGLVMSDVSCFRTAVKQDLTLLEMIDLVKRRYRAKRQWHNWLVGVTLGIPSKNDVDPVILDKKTENLVDLAEVFFQYKDQFKLVVSGDHGYVYTNNISLLDSIIKKPYVMAKHVCQATIVRQKDTVCLRRSSHSYRTYFNDCKIDPDAHHTLSEYLFSQTDWRLSPALQRWCLSSLPWLQRGHFVDHNTASEITMLELIKSGIIRKTMPIVEVNNSTNYSSGN